MLRQLWIATLTIVLGSVFHTGYCDEPCTSYCHQYIANKYLDQMFVGEGELPSYEIIERRFEFLLRDHRSFPTAASFVKDFCDRCRGKCNTKTQFVQCVASEIETLAERLRKVARLAWDLELSYLENEQFKDRFKLEKSPTKLLENAKKLAKSEEWERAIAELSRVIRLAPESFDARLIRSKCYIAEENFSSALVDADFCLTTSPNDVDTRLFHCQASLACADFRQAAADADDLLHRRESLSSETEVRVRLMRALAVLGRSLFETEGSGNTADLPGLCQDVLKFSPNHRSALYVLAVLESQRGNFRQAENAYQDLLVSHPDFLHAKMRYAECLIETARSEPIERAISLCKELIPLAGDVDSSFVHCLLAEAEMRRQSPWAAIRHWSEALSAFPQNVLALSRREQAFRQLGDTRLADQDAAALAKHIDNSWAVWRGKRGGFPLFTLSLNP